MIAKLVAEFVGCLFFIGVVLFTGESIPIGVGLSAAIFLTAKVSGGHLNPAVSAAMLARGDIDAPTFIGYSLAQVLGGLSALAFRSLAG
jgi:glycerol uptake facilitator-like aquaporin